MTTFNFNLRVVNEKRGIEIEAETLEEARELLINKLDTTDFPHTRIEAQLLHEYATTQYAILQESGDDS